MTGFMNQETLDVLSTSFSNAKLISGAYVRGTLTDLERFVLSVI